METSSSQERNYNTISPSAKSLLLLKGLTDIPYARAAAELISRPEQYVPDYANTDLTFWMRVLHFEHRYRTIDQLLAGLNIHNILELSSGFSFRGLAAIQDNDTYYIDTDLPDLIHTKQDFIASLQDKNTRPKGTLEVLPLNAVDGAQFEAITALLPPGPVAIVNEGLLMYLGIEEKKQLCGNIRAALLQRGGYWITADIYIKTGQRAPALKMNDQLQTFLEQHRVEDNMFESFEEAEAFFKGEGLIIDKEAEPEYVQSGVLKYLMASATEEQLADMGKAGKIQTTWRLKAES